MSIVVRRLAPEDDRTGFHRGNIELDRFFLRYAGQNQFRHHIGTSYVAIDEQRGILGFATVTASELTLARRHSTKRRRLPAYPLPVLRLARLAVDERARGLGVCALLLRAVFQLAHQMADDMGCVGVVVDAKTEAVSYYRQLGFVPLEVRTGLLGDRPQPLPMFLELGAIQKSKQ